MDDHHLAFGCYTTYAESIFLKRVSDTTFEESPVILHTKASTEIGGEGGVSLRECFLYLAAIASTDSYRYPTRYGVKLVSHLLWSYSSKLKFDIDRRFFSPTTAKLSKTSKRLGSIRLRGR
jgi:hypothetical protein